MSREEENSLHQRIPPYKFLVGRLCRAVPYCVWREMASGSLGRAKGVNRN